MDKVFLSVDDVLADEDFLAWYFKGSVKKAATWEQWLADHPDRQPLVNEAIGLLSEIHSQEKEIAAEKVEAAAKKLNAAIEGREAPVISIKKPRKRWWLSAAAVLAAVAGLAIWKYSNSKEVLATNYGQLSQHVLPDGSEVMLNANSTVTLGENWDNGDREVWLKGEAFFHVKKTSAVQRFIVHTDLMDVIVTGTQFNVITRDDKSSVLLTEGSVTVLSKEGKEIKMVPGDFVEIETNKVEKKTANEEAILAWKENRLYFDNTFMKDAAKMISAHYGVKVKLADDSVGMKTLNGMMPNDNLDVLLKALEATAEFRITRNENEILISNP